jgi:hypothetical protein
VLEGDAHKGPDDDGDVGTIALGWCSPRRR